VNPVTNKVFVSNLYDNSVTEIDGGTNTTTTIPGVSGHLAVNPVTNKIYAANYASLSLGVIDGATNAVTYIPIISRYSVGVNPASNKIYVSDSNAGGITVIDGATNALTTLLPGTDWGSVVVSPLTNKIDSASYRAPVTALVIDGATNAVIELPIGSYSLTEYSIAVDPAIDKIYIAGQNMTVIDGATNAITTDPTPDPPVAVTVNQATGKIYLSMYGNNFGYGVAVLDSPSNSAGDSLLTRIQNAAVAAVNPATNVAYAALQGPGNIVVLSDKDVQPSPLIVAITPLADNTATVATPTFSFQASSTFAPYDLTPRNVLFQVDTWQGTWSAATSEGSGKFQGTTPALLPGFHILYAYATDGQQATSTITGAQSSLLIGSVAAYGFLVVAPAD